MTEPRYIRGLERALRNAAIEIVIPHEHGVPLTLVSVACRHKAAAEDAAKRLRDDFAAYDEVWCIFDVDEHPHLNDAWQKARANGIRLAISNPCFELWLLLHFRDSPGPQHRQELQRMLRHFILDYDKRLDFDLVKHGVSEAKLRARRLDDDADEMGETGRNPTSGMHRLVESMERV